ncbi:MAG: cold shock domain-containing protein [FCB group bacterium]|nr:cold shock domain-containing protein [FCB group bacterium]
MIGKVKWFDKKKGFGFILNDDMEDVFIHFSDIDGKGYRVLETDDEVEYESTTGPKGLQAKNVTILKRVAADSQDNT